MTPTQSERCSRDEGVAPSIRQSTQTRSRCADAGSLMSGGQPSRTVTRKKCPGCFRTFVSHRADARYCSGRCRQRAHRAQQIIPDIDRAIEEARLNYWWLVRLKATGRNMTLSQVLTGESQFVDADGNVYACGSKIGPFGAIVGKTLPPNTGWSRWGLEAAGPPFAPPPTELGAARQARLRGARP